VKYAIMSFEGKPSVVFVEETDRVVVHTGDREADEREQNFLDKMGFSSIDDAIGGGYSYHDSEIGDYAGAEKAKVDKVIASLASGE
jgi:hypothetical protein